MYCAPAVYWRPTVGLEHVAGVGSGVEAVKGEVQNACCARRKSAVGSTTHEANMTQGSRAAPPGTVDWKTMVCFSVVVTGSQSMAVSPAKFGLFVWMKLVQYVFIVSPKAISAGVNVKY